MTTTRNADIREGSWEAERTIMKKLLSLIISMCMFLALVSVQNVKADESETMEQTNKSEPDYVQTREIDPKLIIESYELENNNIVFGDETTLHVTLKNMSKTHSENEVLVSYSSNAEVVPAEGYSNQFYIESIAPQETVKIALPVSVISSKTGYITISFALRYAIADEELKQVINNTTFITIPIVTGGELEIDNVNVANTAVAGSKAIVGVSYSNSSKETIESAKLILEYDGKTEEISIGSIEGNKNGYVEGYISFENEGAQSVRVAVEYTDVAGKTVELNQGTYFVNVTAKKDVNSGNSQNSNNNSEQTRSGVTDTVLLLVLVIILICGLFGLLYSRKKK